jgi:hypothetical protein
MSTFKAPYQSIDNAPKDRAILTDEGTAIYVDQRNWGSPVTNGWYLCTPQGDFATCADDGMSVSRIYPQCWMEIPSWH